MSLYSDDQDRHEDWLDKIITPRVGAVAVVESANRGSLLLIRRAYPPFGLAFPGGFVEIGESVSRASAREVMEETGIAAEEVGLLAVTSEPNLDTRHHFVVVASVFRALGDQEPKAGDDAQDAFWASWQELEIQLKNGFPSGGEVTERTLFELREYLRWRREGHDWLGTVWRLPRLG
jgi:ADP-ribose pyrophosphatase YjhB (NUDIX family)